MFIFTPAALLTVIGLFCIRRSNRPRTDTEPAKYRHKTLEEVTRIDRAYPAMICPSCSYDASFLGKKRRFTFHGFRSYCPNCGQYLDKSIPTIIEGELKGTNFRIDEATNTLVQKKRPLFTQTWIRENIPMSEIGAVSFYKFVVTSQYGSSDYYSCDLLLNYNWRRLICKGNAQEILSTAYSIGRRIEKPEDKIGELGDYLYKTLNLPSQSIGVCHGLQEPLKIEYIGYELDKNKFEIEGIIPLENPDIDKILVLHCASYDHYYYLGYVLNCKVIDNVWTHRKKKMAGLGHLKEVEWRGGPLSEYLNSDTSLKELLVNHLDEAKCGIVISPDQCSGSLLMIFGDGYPRQWGRLPKSMFPSTNRLEVVKKVAEKVRGFSS